MDLQIEQRERQGITILDLKGRLVLGPEDLSLLQMLLFLLDHKRRQVILNLNKVSDIDSAAFDTLAFCARRFHDAGGKLAVLKLDRRIPRSDGEENAAFEIYQEESDAVNSFFPERTVRRYDILEFVKTQHLR